MTVENVVNKLDRNLSRFLIIAETAAVPGIKKGQFMAFTFNDHEKLDPYRYLEVYAIGISVNGMITIYI